LNYFFWHGAKSFPFSQISYGFVFGCVLSLFFFNTPVFFVIILLSVSISVFYEQFRTCCLAILLAFCYVMSYYHVVYNWYLPVYFRGAQYPITATVLKIVPQNEKAFCKVKLTSLNHQLISPLKKVYGDLTIYQYQQNLKVGDSFSVVAKLKPYNQYRNTKLPNYELHAFYQGTKVKGYFIGQHITQHTKAALSRSLKYALQQVVQHTEQQGLYYALLFGDKSKLSPQLKEQFKLAGLSHMLAISGLHIGILYSAAFFVAKWFTLALPIRLTQTLNLNRFYSYFGLFSAFIYVWLSDFMVSALRAFVMLSVLVMLYWGKKRYISLSALTLALVVILLLNPFELLNPGLYFSFIAVVIILLVYRRIVGNLSIVFVTVRRTLVLLIAIQLALFFGLLPLSWFYFSGVSLASMLINIIVLPIFSILLPLLLVLILVAFLFGMSAPLMLFDQVLSTVMEYFLALSLDVYWLELGFVSWQQVILIYLVGSFLLFTILHRLVWLPIVALLSESNLITQVSWQITTLDVGHGLSVVISKNKQALVYDLGAKFDSGHSVAQSQVYPFLKAHGLTVTQTIISHADNDHAGGLDYWQTVGLSNTVLFGIDVEGKPKFCIPQTHTFMGLTINILGPIIIRGIRNNNSCIVQVTDGSFSALLVGDIHQEAELALIKQYPNLKADLLISPHHGSKSSSSELFIRQLQPSYIIHANARWSRWDMPHSTVQLRYHDMGAIQMQTAQLGGITVKILPDELQFTAARTEQRYWFLTN